MQDFIDKLKPHQEDKFKIVFEDGSGNKKEFQKYGKELPVFARVMAKSISQEDLFKQVLKQIDKQVIKEEKQEKTNSKTEKTK